MNKEYCFPGVNTRNPIIIVYVIFFIVYFILYIFFAFSIPSIWIKIIFFTLSLISPIYIFYVFSTKIIINEVFIKKKSLFGSKTIRFRDVKKYGLYLQGLGWAVPIAIDELDRKESFEVALIYITCNQDYNPLTSFNPKGTIRFHYSEEIYIMIKNRLKENNNEID